MPDCHCADSVHALLDNSKSVKAYETANLQGYVPWRLEWPHDTFRSTYNAKFSNVQGLHVLTLVFSSAPLNLAHDECLLDHAPNLSRLSQLLHATAEDSVLSS